MEQKIRMKLYEVYGGDGFTRPHEVTQTKLSRAKKRTVTRRDVGVPIEAQTDEEKSEVKKSECNTFKRDAEGKYYLRLGGVHGKLWGTMKEAGYMLYQTGALESKAITDRVMRSVWIIPEWVCLEKTNGVEMVALPQILGGMNKSFIQIYFDKIPECEAEITLRYPKEFESHIKKLLAATQEINCLNKRRGRITIP